MSTSEQKDLTVSVPWSVQEDLLLDVAAPALDESMALGETKSWFYLRENHGGRPFLRLRFNTASPSVERRLKSRILEKAGASAGHDDIFAYQPYNHEHDWLGGTAGQSLAEAFWAETTPLALRTLRATRGDRALRLAVAFDFLVCSGVLLAPRLPPPVAKFGFRAGYLSYLATFEGYMLLIRDPEGTRAKHAERYEQNRNLLRPRLRSLVDAMGEPDGDLGDVPELAREWTLRQRSYLPAIQEGFDSGRFYLYATPRKAETAKLTPSPDGLYRRPQIEWLADLPEAPVAGIHRAIADNRFYQGMIREDRRFLASRLAQAYTHWHLYRLGFLLADRYTLFYLIARAFEEEYDLDAAEMIRSVGPEAEVAG
ncbi:lantibiotic dehydratase C-terminal domain-containing protein [Streptomyces yaizuensis]|uniref:Thiopeptide-type bacteriocin biosynthesis protein n=1 Tax=Streptomyces yaizuensis TaxID=2989713 RepID=A0ABQ5P2K5_9ACTN|nr:lantibiotic dehydratase C-terminal domain-containing protein [Streptomyces sp. YSPA8]GLF96710.1 thiopeptide-type bacteriocin biosynthesis protein [Streptomyces sp. YSPA8]